MGIRVLFVCLGNICRSPTAEGVFRQLCSEAGIDHAVSADSAGTGGYHVGDPPDERSQRAARARGIEIGNLRARQVSVTDFEAFDYVLAMDRKNHRHLTAMCPPTRQGKLHLLMDFAPESAARELPDPYFSDGDGFELVLDLAETAGRGLVAQIREQHLAPR